MFLRRNGKLYSISVATPEHRAYIQAHNQSLDDPDLHPDANVLVMDNVDDEDQLCQLLLQARLEDLMPYLCEQRSGFEADDEEGEGAHVDPNDPDGFMEYSHGLY